MQTIIYSEHTPKNHLLIANKIREERPKLYLDESSEVLNPAYKAFCKDKSMPPEDLDKRCAALGWGRIESGIHPIYVAAREVGAQIIGVEDEKAARGFWTYLSNESRTFEYLLSLRVLKYHIDKRIINSGKRPTTKSLEEFLGSGSFDPDELMQATMSEDPREVVEQLGSEMDELKNRLSIWVGKVIERDKAMVERIARLGNVDMVGYFGLAHRTISPLLLKGGLVIPYGIIGQIVLDPKAKYCMLLTYEMLNLDPKELRSPDPNLDCDPVKKEFYLSLIPRWLEFKNFSKMRGTDDEQVKSFWANLDAILGSP